jgi:hypothetical protein
LHHEGGAVVTHAIIRATIRRGDDDVEALERCFISGKVGNLDVADQLVSFHAGPTINTFGVVRGQAVDLVTGLQDCTGFFFVGSH